jgi:hypothetical protein
MGRGALPAGLILLATLFSFPADAWAPETRVRMTEAALKLMPASLQLALESHREALLRGALEPLTREDDPEHRPPWAGGTIDAKLVSEVHALVALLADPKSFKEIAGRFGAVAHYAADSGFPPGMTDTEGAGHYRHFANFCESRRERFPWVFYGHDDADLQNFDYAAWVRATMQRARVEDRGLSRAYKAAGDPPHPSAFDDRSIPFAIASISYSKTVTDIARIWIAAWAEAGGDMGYTPYKEARPRDD